jgi:hypothetical protein
MGHKRFDMRPQLPAYPDERASQCSSACLKGANSSRNHMRCSQSLFDFHVASKSLVRSIPLLSEPEPGKRERDTAEHCHRKE